jgi:hypothetical protein
MSRRAEPDAASAVALTDAVAAPVAAISWGAVLAGMVIVLALQVLLNLLGLGVGLSLIDPASGTTPELGSLSLGAGLWFVVTSWLALAAGGYVAAYLATTDRAQEALLHGLITWGFTLVLSAYVLTSATGAVLSGAASLAGSAASTAGQAIGVVAPQVAETVQEEGPDLRGLITEAIRPQDPGQMSPEELDDQIVQAVTRLATGDEQGAIDRDRLVQMVAARTGLSPQEATARLEQIETQARDAVAAAEQTARATADEAAAAGSQDSLWAALALLIGAVAAAIGGLVGRRDRLRVLAKVPVRG